MDQLTAGDVANIVLAAVALLGVVGMFVNSRSREAVRDAKIEALEAWKIEHVETSHETLGQLDRKVDGIARDLNQLIGRFDGMTDHAHHAS